MSVAGGNLAYSVFNSSVGVWTLTASGGGQVSVGGARPITSAAERIEAVRMSPDGKSLAFDSDRSGNMDIYRINIDGSGLQQLTTNSADEFRPVWSPDGKQILFQSWRSGNRDVYAINADGSGEHLVVGGPKHEWSESWSPDGKTVAITSDRDGKGINVWTVPSTGGPPRRLTSEGGFGPRFSPDGTMIAYIGARFVSPGDPGAASGLHVLNLATGEDHIALQPGMLGTVTSIGGWSADSKTIYFRILSPAGTYDIAQVSVDGSKPRVLIRFDRPDRAPYRSDFTTDGKTFYFTIGEHLADIWVMQLKKKYVLAISYQEVECQKSHNLSK